MGSCDSASESLGAPGEKIPRECNPYTGKLSVFRCFMKNGDKGTTFCWMFVFCAPGASPQITRPHEQESDGHS